MLTVEDIINYNEKYNLKLPAIQVGNIANLFDIWDGEGEAPTESYCYALNDNFEFINYEFKVINAYDIPEEQVIRITSIELI